MAVPSATGGEGASFTAEPPEQQQQPEEEAEPQPEPEPQAQQSLSQRRAS